MIYFRVKYEVVRQIAEETLEEVLGKGDYDASTAPKVSKNIAERIIQQLSSLLFFYFKQLKSKVFFI